MNSTQDKPLLSVIMPVYNAAAYIDFTIQNLLKDQFSDIPDGAWELIIVDDGSTDSSVSQIQNYTNSNNSVTLISQPNFGAAAARNTGLEAAKGEYVYFVDSDDIIPRGVIALLRDVLITQHPDILKFTFKHISHEEYLNMQSDIPTTNVTIESFNQCSGLELLDITKGMTTPSTDCTVLSVYLRAFLTNNHLKFNQQLRIGEDVDLSWRTMLLNPHISYTLQPLYFYHQHDKSISHDPARQKLYNEGMLTYLLCLLNIHRSYTRILSGKTCSGLTGLNNSIRFNTNMILSLKVISGDSYSNIFRTMLLIKRHGGDIHTGRPRFNHPDTHNSNSKAHLRRWVTAYIIATIVALIPTSKRLQWPVTPLT